MTATAETGVAPPMAGTLTDAQPASVRAGRRAAPPRGRRAS